MIIVNQKRNRKIDMVFEFEDNILTLFGSYFWRFKFHLEIISVFVISTIGLQGLIGGSKIVYESTSIMDGFKEKLPSPESHMG